MTVEQRIEDPVDQFPIGMRVLAVDDDPTCLKLLETLLRRCQYHVTTTNQAITALNMLRENQNKFDLVISDVHMPGIDGFKLLELVGLEMDLPVIMLSANGDRNLVMKGISHGACDYLLKPVRIEELKNIWQHVIRRKKLDSKSQRSSRSSGAANNGGEGDPSQGGPGSLDQNGKVTKKRKDQDDDDDDNNDDNEDDSNDDPSAQKKPRVVWSVDLHRKFVAAVNQLGIDKAVPKKILDLMNVEKLTRENVASHLQKYRLYLKRISCVANQQANMVAAFGTTDSSYMRMNSINGHGNFNPLTMSVPFQSQSYRPFPPGRLIGRLNSPANLGLCLPSSGGMVQMGHSNNNQTNPNDQMKFHDPTMLQGISIPFELDQQQQHVVDNFTESKMLMLGSQHVDTDPNRCIDNWSSSAQSSCFQSNSYPLSDRFRQTALSGAAGSRDGVLALRSAGNQHYDGSSVSVQSQNSISDSAQCQVPGVGSNALVSSWDNIPNKLQDPSYRSNHMNNPLMPVNGGVIGSMDHSLELKNTIFQRDHMDFNGSMGQPNYGDPSMVRYEEVERSTMEAKLRQDYAMAHQHRSQGSYIMNHFGALGDIVTSNIKQERNKGEGDFDSFPIGNGNLV